MRWPTIVKHPGDWRVAPNLTNYARTCADFTWERARQDLDGLPEDRGLNIAHEAVDRHSVGARATRIAIRWLSKDGSTRDYTYADLRTETRRFANLLK